MSTAYTIVERSSQPAMRRGGSSQVWSRLMNASAAAR